MVPKIFWTCSDEIAPVAPRFVHFSEVGLDGSPQGSCLLETNALFRQIVGPPPHFDKDQFISFKCDQIDFTTPNLVIPGDNGIAQTQEIQGGSVFCRSTSSYF